MGRICDVNMEGIRRLVEEQNANLAQVLNSVRLEQWNMFGRKTSMESPETWHGGSS